MYQFNNKVVMAVQLFLCTIILFCCGIERFPISIAYTSGITNSKKIQELRTEAGMQGTFIDNYINDAIGSLEKYFEYKSVLRSKWKKFILIIIDVENLYNLVLLSITIVAFNYHLVYSILLLDIVKRSEDL